MFDVIVIGYWVFLLLLVAAPTKMGIVGVAAKIIDSGKDMACMVRPDNVLDCWGRGSLGDGKATSFSDHSTEVPGIVAPRDISVGAGHACAVILNGSIKCWGSNTFGQLGDGTRTSSDVPVSVLSITNAVAVGAGVSHSCSLLSAGTVKCWGANEIGQLGDGSTASTTCAVSVSSLMSAIALDVGNYFSCALILGGTIKCWGDNIVGNLGDGTTTSRSAPVSVSSITTAIDMCLGFFHACALLSGGSIKCWGYSYSGELGDGYSVGSTTGRSTPVSVFSITNAIAIAAGQSHTCAILADRTVKCWGYNGHGQLGDGTNWIERATPVSVLTPFFDAAALSAGESHTCIYRSNTGEAYCFGERVVLGNSDNLLLGLPIASVPNAVAVAGGSAYSCALLSNGTIKCWGTNYNGFGNGNSRSSYTPLSVSSITTAIAIDVGDNHACAVLSSGTIKCWGSNDIGQLADGTRTNRDTPVSVLSITNAIAISTGQSHTCAILVGGIVKCWGSNTSGQLGDGSFIASSTPVTVSLLRTVVSIALGSSHACAILSSEGVIKCWGSNDYGQLGAYTWGPSPTPISVSSITNATAVSAGAYHSCAVLSDGTVKCWGLGFDTIPVSVSSLAGVTAITAGAYHSCALLSGGSVKCWGDNYYGQLGDGSTTQQSYTTPVSVLSITDATAIGAGSDFSCAIVFGGIPRCWGKNDANQLGMAPYVPYPNQAVVSSTKSPSSSPTKTTSRPSGTLTNSPSASPSVITYCDSNNRAKFPIVVELEENNHQNVSTRSSGKTYPFTDWCLNGNVGTTAAYSFSPKSTGSYTFSFSGLSAGFSANVEIVTCVGSVLQPGTCYGQDSTLTFWFSAGVTYYFLLQAYDNGTVGDGYLSISQASSGDDANTLGIGLGVGLGLGLLLLAIGIFVFCRRRSQGNPQLSTAGATMKPPQQADTTVSSLSSSSRPQQQELQYQRAGGQQHGQQIGQNQTTPSTISGQQVPGEEDIAYATVVDPPEMNGALELA